MHVRYFRAWVSYDGTDFCGFQDQAGKPSIQSALNAAVAHICQSPFKIQGAGRTDAGVHARAQAISIEMQTDLNTEKLVLALSHTLPKAIRISRVDEFPGPFDPKRTAVGKRYVYRVWNGLASDPFRDRFSWHLRRKLNVSTMAEAAKGLIGDLDYESFRSSKCSAAHARRTIWAVNVTKQGNSIEIDVRGNAFCHNMVRIISGTLIEVGIGKKKPEDIPALITARDRTKAGLTAPAKGLTLEEIYYPDNLDDAEIPSDANFPRYPVTEQSWPFKKNEVAIGSDVIR